MKLLNITKEIDELSIFEKLFLLDRIWKDLSEALEGLVLTCAADESIMEEVNNYCDDDDEVSLGLFDEKWSKENLPSNVVSIHDKNKY